MAKKTKVRRPAALLQGVDHTVHTFESGAQRSQVMPRYDLIPRVLLKRLAGRFEMGLKYGEHNYKLGLPFDDTFNHIVDHLLNYKERRKEYFRKVAHGEIDPKIMSVDTYMSNTETDGDDLAAAAWGIAAVMYLELQGKLL